jgi:hypothetical protein
MADGDRRASIESVISTAIQTQLKDVHTMLPGQIIKFDPATQLADIQPLLKRKVGDKLINLPVLASVPVRFLKSKAFTITFPLVAGDEVSLYFIERSIDNWLTEGGIQSPNDTRKFDLSDAYAVPVLYSQKEILADFDPANLEIRNTANDTKITFKPSGEVVITATKTTVTGNLDVLGTITAPTIQAASSLTIAGTEVKAHVHGGVTAGAANTSALA